MKFNRLEAGLYQSDNKLWVINKNSTFPSTPWELRRVNVDGNDKSYCVIVAMYHTLREAKQAADSTEVTEKQMVSAGWQSMGYLREWLLFRRIENNMGKWCILYNGKPLPITYNMARGYDALPIPEDGVYKLSKQLGEMLLPR